MPIMQRRLISIFLSFIIAVGLVAFLLANVARSTIVQAAPNLDKIDPALLEALVDDTAVRFIAEMNEVATLPTTAARTLAERTAVLNNLQQIASSSQATALATLDTLATTGDAASVRSLWIVNSIAATGNLRLFKPSPACPKLPKCG